MFGWVNTPHRTELSRAAKIIFYHLYNLPRANRRTQRIGDWGNSRMSEMPVHGPRDTARRMATAASLQNT